MSKISALVLMTRKFNSFKIFHFITAFQLKEILKGLNWISEFLFLKVKKSVVSVLTQLTRESYLVL